LDVLIKAVEAMKMLRRVADEHLTTEQYMQALTACSALNANVNYIAEQIKVEVPA
jgi:hypothetical protein